MGKASPTPISSDPIDVDDTMGPMVSAPTSPNPGGVPVDGGDDPMEEFLAREKQAFEAINSQVSAMSLSRSASRASTIHSNSSSSIIDPINPTGSTGPIGPSVSSTIPAQSPTLPSLFPKGSGLMQKDTPALQAWRAERDQAIAEREKTSAQQLEALYSKAAEDRCNLNQKHIEEVEQRKKKLETLNKDPRHLLGEFDGDLSDPNEGITSAKEIDWDHILRVIEVVHREIGRSGKAVDGDSKMVQMIAYMTKDSLGKKNQQ